MEELLREITEGIEARLEIVRSKNRVSTYNHEYSSVNAERQGIGSKSYITKRIDILREKLLEEKKKLK